MTIRAQKPKIPDVGCPVTEAATPIPSCFEFFDLLGSINMVDVDGSDVIKSASGALAAKRMNDFHFSGPVARVFVSRGSVFVPVGRLARWRTKLRFAYAATLSALAVASPSCGQVASLAAIFTRAVFDPIRVHFCGASAVSADDFYRAGSFFSHARNVTKYIGENNPKYFDIARRRITEALKQPDLFIEPPKPAKQEVML